MKQVSDGHKDQGPVHWGVHKMKDKDKTKGQLVNELADLRQRVAELETLETERKRAEEEAQRRATQTALIYEVGQRVSGELELDALLSEIVTAVCDAFDYYGVTLMLLDEETKRLTLQSIAGGYADIFSEDLGLNIGEGMVGYAAATGETQVSGDVGKDPHYVRKAEEETKSELAVPIKSGQKVIGVLDIQSCEFDAFNETDVTDMETLSTQIATAIENARLLEATRTHIEELAVLNELGQALTARLDVDQVLDEAYRGAARLVDTTDFYIVLYNPNKDEITFALDVVGGKAQKPHIAYRAGQGLAEHIIRSRTPLLIKEDLPKRLEEMGIELLGRPALSWVGVPLVIGDRVLGMMAAVQSPTTLSGYDEHDRDLLLSIASQTAIALQNAYLFEETQRRVIQLALINDIGEKIAAVLELDAVMERTTHLVQESFGYHHVALFTVDHERDELVMRARDGDFAHLFPPDHRLKLGQGIVGWAGHHGETLLANDVDAEPRYINLYPGTVPTQSELSVPIRVGEEIVGVLDVQSPQLGDFDESDVMVMETLADQVAVAVANARLYETIRQELAERVRAEEAVRQRNQELALLNRASQALSATLDLDQVLVTVLEEVRRLLDVIACSVWLVESSSPAGTGEGQGEQLVCWHAVGPESEIVRGWRLSPGEGIAGWVAHSGESLIISDAQTDGRYFGGVDRQTGLETRSILSVPLRAKQEVIGVLQVVDADAGRFGQAELALVELLAASASTAIENARLHREVLDYAEQLEERVRERTAQLAAQYAQSEAILQSITDGIVVTNAEGEILQANPVAQAWLTRSLSPENVERLQETVRDLARRIEERPETVLELTGLDLELRAAPVSEPGGEEATAVVDIHDVSHLKALNRMKTRFVTNISHELRTPVTTIKLYANLMRRKPEKWEQYLDTLEQEADRQARLVEDILQISRIDAGRLEMTPNPTLLNELVELSIIRHQRLSESRDVTLEHQSAGPGPVALVDQEWMMLVLDNLVDNALLYTPEGGKVVVSTGTEEAEERTWATVTVVDSGMGVPEEDLPHLFERFFRGEEPRSMQISGTGLGLAIVKGVVELHGGRVMAESEEGVGSTFTVWLPLAYA